MMLALYQAAQTDDTGCYVGLVAVILIAIFLFWIMAQIGASRQEEDKAHRDAMSPEEREAEDKKIALEAWGPINPSLICPHCQAQGNVRVKPATRKAGISGGKATAAVLTGGVSVLATGLSRKETITQAHCDKCSSSWQF